MAAPSFAGAAGAGPSIQAATGAAGRAEAQQLPEEKITKTEDRLTDLRQRGMEPTANPADTNDPRVTLGPPGPGPLN